MEDRYIPVITEEKRLFPYPDRRREKNEKLIPKENDRRKGDPERRKIRGITKDDLSNVTDILREEQDTLIKFISDKEQKKLQVLRFQIAAVVILGAATITALPLIESFFSTFVSKEITKPLKIVYPILIAYNFMGIIVVFATCLMGFTVVQHIMSIKSNVMLAVRQLNCNREAIQDVIAARLCGTYTIGGWKSNDDIDWEPAKSIYLRHNKFPTNNSGLRKSFFRRYRSKLYYILTFLPGFIFEKSYRHKCEKCKDCTGRECKNKHNDDNCVEILTNGKMKTYTENRYNEVYIDDESDLPRNWFSRLSLFGFRAAYIQSADMMAVVATSTITILAALLLPLGNVYLWYRMTIQHPEIETEFSLLIPLIFVTIDLFIIIFLASHFYKIIVRAMDKIVILLTSESGKTSPSKKHEEIIKNKCTRT